MGRFALHTLVGVVMFAVVGGAAVFLNYFTNLIEQLGISPYIVVAIQGLEFFLFAVDFLCLVIFIVKETWVFCREIIR
jgi:hypothetical protein